MLDAGAAEVGALVDDALGQAEAGGEVVQVGGGHHHDGVGHGAIDDVDGNLDRDGPGARLLAGAIQAHHRDRDLHGGGGDGGVLLVHAWEIGGSEGGGEVVPIKG